MLIRVAGCTILMHTLQIVVWAVSYASPEVIPDPQTAFYFIAVDYTTTGYGDVVPPVE